MNTQSPPTTLSEERLLPCPFCGKQPTSKFCSVGVPGMEDCGYWGIDCTCGMSQVHADDEEFAIEKWNNRHAAEQMAQASQEIYILQMLLKDAKCPECDGSGTVVTLDRREQPYQMQCQWCHYKAEALKSLPPAPEKGGVA